MDMSVSIQFLVTSLIIVLMPGPGVLYTLSAALTRGFRASIVAAFGCTIGIVPQIAAVILGLAALLRASASAYEIFKYVGVVYLLYIAWKTLGERGALDVDGRTQPGSAMRVIVRAVLINLLNPKLAIFFLAFLPQFIPASDPHALADMIGLSGVFMLMTFVVFVIYGFLAASFRDRVIGRPGVMTWVRRSFAGAFISLGVKLALSSR
ncbi:MAG TPA: LysE family translocator [Acidiphilium sp.]